MIAVEHAAIKANRIMLLANATTAARNQQKLTNNYGSLNWGGEWENRIGGEWARVAYNSAMCGVMSTPSQAKRGPKGDAAVWSFRQKVSGQRKEPKRDLCMRKNFTSH